MSEWKNQIVMLLKYIITNQFACGVCVFVCVCRSVARDKTTLSSLGVTHVLNAAAGRHRINTGQQFYSDLKVDYHSVEAADHPEFDLRPFFKSAAQFMDSALKRNGEFAKFNGNKEISTSGI